jgi:hypothetical protein
MVAHTCNPSTLEGEIGGSQIPGKSELPRKILSQNKTRNIWFFQCDCKRVYGPDFKCVKC